MRKIVLLFILLSFQLAEASFVRPCYSGQQAYFAVTSVFPGEASYVSSFCTDLSNQQVAAVGGNSLLSGESLSQGPGIGYAEWLKDCVDSLAHSYLNKKDNMESHLKELTERPESSSPLEAPKLTSDLSKNEKLKMSEMIALKFFSFKSVVDDYRLTTFDSLVQRTAENILETDLGLKEAFKKLYVAYSLREEFLCRAQ